MNKRQQSGYNFNSVDLLIYIWNKRFLLLAVGFLAAVASIVISILITPMFQASVIMFPSTSSSVSKELLVQNYSSRQGVHGFGEEEQAEQLLQILYSEPIRKRIVEEYNLMEHYEINPDGKYPKTELYETYKSNINFRLTEFMSVEISVMDADPEISASIANKISDLVDTVYYDMKKNRSQEALRLVEREFREAENNLKILKDSLDILSAEQSRKIQTKKSEDPAIQILKAISENGALYITMLYLVRNEAQIVADLSLRYKEARLESEKNLPYKFIVEKAYPPEKKAYPKKSLIVIVATFASLLFALIVLIIIDSIKEKVSAKEE